MRGSIFSGQSHAPKLVLASKSASRQAMLTAADVAYEARPSSVDERVVEQDCGDAPPAKIAETLAQAKAFAVAVQDGVVVLGSDSLVTVDGCRFDKPASREQAAKHLRFFSGKTMELHSAAALIGDGKVIWSHTETARLKVRHLSDEFIETYLHAEWPEVSHCVGVFRIEALGIQLFERIEGSHFTVLGMPLLPVLGALREAGVLPE